MLTLMELPFAYDALEPIISKETVTYHHDKHHQTYVDTSNQLMEGTELSDLDCPKEALLKLKEIEGLEDKRQKLVNNLGGVYNHNLYWKQMVPGGSKEPEGELKEAIDKAFGSFEDFKKEFVEAGKARFGSGWAWLIVDNGEVKVISTANQDTPIYDGQSPLLLNDVWEHAYYLDYQNKRPDYLEKYWDLINWDVIAERFEKANK